MIPKNPELIAAGVTFLIVLIDAFRRYRQNGDLRLYQLPWIEFRALFEFGRRAIFTIDKPDSPSITVDHSLDELKRILGKQGVKPNHPFSYVYEGEVFNGVFYYLDYDREIPHRQIHIRAFPLDEGLEIMAHEEPCWYSHPVKHLKSNDMEYEPANEWTKQRLENAVPVGYPSD